MFETFRNAWKTEDLRKRLLYTLLILILFRLGCAIPVPYILSLIHIYQPHDCCAEREKLRR